MLLHSFPYLLLCMFIHLAYQYSNKYYSASIRALNAGILHRGFALECFHYTNNLTLR